MTTTSFATDSLYAPDNNTPTTASPSLSNTTSSETPANITSTPAVFTALVDIVRNADLVNWTEPEAKHRNRQSNHTLFGYWTSIGLSCLFFTALSSYIRFLPPQKWVEFSHSPSPSTIRRGPWAHSQSPLAVDKPISGTSDSTFDLDNYFVMLLFGVFWSAYTSFISLADAVLVFYGVRPGQVEDRRLNPLLEDVASGKLVVSQDQEGVQLERFVSHPVVLRSMVGIIFFGRYMHLTVITLGSWFNAAVLRLRPKETSSCNRGYDYA